MCSGGRDLAIWNRSRAACSDNQVRVDKSTINPKELRNLQDIEESSTFGEFLRHFRPPRLFGEAVNARAA